MQTAVLLAPILMRITFKLHESEEPLAAVDMAMTDVQIAHDEILQFV